MACDRLLSGSTTPIEHRPALAEDPARRCPDITRIRMQTGWEPRVLLEEGLQRTIAWFRTVVPGALAAPAHRAAQEAAPLAVS
jgi:dTDP-glucose 4,6-dehydratase